MKQNKITVSRNENTPIIPPRPDFATLANNVASAAKPFYKTSLFYGSAGLAAVLAIFTAAYLYFKTPLKSVPQAKIQTAETVIHPPMKGLELACDTFEVDILHGDTVVCKGCTKLIFPAGCIQKTDGNAPEKTRIAFREFHNQAEILTSGIPMVYDSAGAKNTFESAGMFELKNVNANEHINPGSGIKVELCSNGETNGYNWYRLDEKTGNWTYLQPAVTTKTGAVTEVKKSSKIQTYGPTLMPPVDNSVTTLTNKKSPVPRLRDPRAFTFTVEEPNVPELAIYKNIVFEVLPGQNFNPRTLPDVWDDVKVAPIGNGIYMLTLIDNAKTLKFKSVPVFLTPEDREKGKAAYLAHHPTSQTGQASANPANSEPITEKNTPGNAPMPPVAANYGHMVQAITVSQFGYYNSDRPVTNMEKTSIVSYGVPNHAPLQPQLYQYFLKRNVVMVNYSIADGKTSIAYNAKEAYLLLAISADGTRIACLRPEDFDTQVKQGAKDIVLQPANRTFASAADIHQWVSSNFMGQGKDSKQ